MPNSQWLHSSVLLRNWHFYSWSKSSEDQFVLFLPQLTVIFTPTSAFVCRMFSAKTGNMGTQQEGSVSPAVLLAKLRAETWLHRCIRMIALTYCKGFLIDGQDCFSVMKKLKGLGVNVCHPLFLLGWCMVVCVLKSEGDSSRGFRGTEHLTKVWSNYTNLGFDIFIPFCIFFRDWFQYQTELQYIYLNPQYYMPLPMLFLHPLIIPHLLSMGNLIPDFRQSSVPFTCKYKPQPNKKSPALQFMCL